MNVHRIIIRMLLTTVPTILLISSLSADDLILKSTVAKVTVYNDRALITRVGEVQLFAGVNTIVIPHLPVFLMDQSLRVTSNADNEAKITDVKIEQKYLDTIPETRVADLYKRLNTLRLEKNGLEQKNLLIKSQMDAVDAFRDNYTKSLTGPNPTQKATTEEWDKLLTFVEKKKTDFSVKMETMRQEIDVKQEKIKALEKEIQNTTGKTGMSEKQVIVIAAASQAGPIEFEVSYLISNVSWMPSYEARVTSNEKSMQLFYYGQVQQSSGEDWTNVALTLSTAQPAISGQSPEISRWIIDASPIYTSRPYSRTSKLKSARPQPLPERTLMANTLSGRVLDAETNEPLIGANIVVLGTSLGAATDIDGNYVIYNIPEGKYSISGSMIGYQRTIRPDVNISRTNGARQNFNLQSAAIEGEEVVVTAQARGQLEAVNQQLASSPMVSVQQEESSASSEITSSSFSIPSKQSIPSDNQYHKIGISLENLPIGFSYEIIPKSVQAAFLTGKGKNVKEYPLLAGEANIFLDNSFVATVPIKTVMPNDSFAINLGVDQALRVERRLVSRFTEQVGMFSTKIRTTYEFEQKVENHKKYSVDIKLSDHIPVSRNEKIVVEQIEPDPKSMAPNSDGILIWKLTLQPDENKIFKLKFAVERPTDVNPYGLE